MDDITGPVIAERYRVTRLVGRTRTAIRYRATDTHGGPDVEVQVAARRPPSRARVDQLLALSHPSLVPILHVDASAERRTVLVSPLVEGTSLAARVCMGPLDPEVARRGFVALARALAHMHDRGVVHGHLEPTAILLVGAESPAMVLTGLDGVLLDGQSIGNPARDLVALGRGLWSALTGTTLGPGASIPVAGSGSDPQIAALEAIARDCAIGGYPSAAALADALEAADPMLALRARTARRRMTAGAMTFGSVLMLGAAGLVVFQVMGAQTAPPRVALAPDASVAPVGFVATSLRAPTVPLVDHAERALPEAVDAPDASPQAPSPAQRTARRHEANTPASVRAVQTAWGLPPMATTRSTVDATDADGRAGTAMASEPVAAVMADDEATARPIAAEPVVGGAGARSVPRASEGATPAATATPSGACGAVGGAQSSLWTLRVGADGSVTGAVSTRVGESSVEVPVTGMARVDDGDVTIDLAEAGSPDGRCRTLARSAAIGSVRLRGGEPGLD